MKRYILIIAMLLGAVSLKAQSSGTPITDKWTLLQDKDNVKIFRSYTLCDGNQKILLKVENGNAKSVTVSWKSLFQISGLKKPVNKDFSVTVDANSILSGSCSREPLSVNPFLYVSTVEEGKCDYVIQEFNIVIL